MRRLGIITATVLALACHGPAGEAIVDDASPPSVPEPEPEPAAIEQPALGAETLAANHDEALEQIRARLLAAAELEPGMVVVDIGASQGAFVDKAALSVGPTGEVHATDIDPHAIAKLRELAGFDNRARAPIEVHACSHQRDTGLSELPDAHVQRMLMIDSLCFDGSFTRDEDVAYLREFFRVLAPGGRLLHHMDCECGPSLDAVIERFEAAGFTTQTRRVELSQPSAEDPTWGCKTPAQRERHGLLLEFSRP